MIRDFAFLQHPKTIEQGRMEKDYKVWAG